MLQTRLTMEKKQSQQPKNILDDISPESLAKIREHQSSTSGSYPVDSQWMILAEWLKIAGYQAYLDARNDARDSEGNLIIDMQEVLTLIAATRKLDAVDHYRNAEATLIGYGSARSRKPSSTFKKLTKDTINQMKVQE